MPEGIIGMDAPKEEPKKHGLGGSFFGKHETEISPISLTDISNQINNLSRRLRIMEERYTNLRRNTQLTDQNILRFNKDFQREISVASSDLSEMRRDFIDLRDKVRLIVRELVECAKTEDVKVLERYINMWDPIKFVTKEEVDKIVEDKIEEKLDEMDLSGKSKDLK